MAGIEVNLSGEDLNRVIAEKVIESTMGQKLIEELKKKLSGGYGSILDSAVTQVVDAEIRVQIRDALRLPENAEKIRQAVAEKLQGEVLGAAVEAAWRAFESQLNRIRD